MKLFILLSSAILFATALTPISVYADDSNLQCRRSSNGCDSRNGGGNGNLSISGFDINVSSSDRSNNRGNDKRNTVANNKTNDNIGNGNDDSDSDSDIDTDNEHADADDTDNTDAGDNDVDAGNVDPGTDNTDAGDNDVDAGNVDPGTDNNDTGASNNSPPQLNSNDINGFDPFGGLYGPGT